MSKRKIITVDGLASSGKSSISKLLSEKLKFCHLSSGLGYRAIALLALRENIEPSDVPSLLALIKQHKIEFTNSGLLIDGEDHTPALLDPKVSEMTSRSSLHAPVRTALLSLQRNAFDGQNMVAEGRDMGTVVFPEANLKFFIIADVAVRIARRIKQLSENSIDPERLKLLKKDMEIEIIERDKRDMERVISPTVAAQDAIIIDNSTESLTKTIDNMYDLVLKKGLL